jgi:hypothetical protein
MRNVVYHLIQKTIEAYEDEIVENCASMGSEIKATFDFSAGQDLTTHQKRFNQTINLNDNDGAVFGVWVNPLSIRTADGVFLYKNAAPQSPRSVRLQKLFFGSDDVITNKAEFYEATTALDLMKLEEFSFHLKSGKVLKDSLCFDGFDI